MAPSVNEVPRVADDTTEQLRVRGEKEHVQLVVRARVPRYSLPSPPASRAFRQYHRTLLFQRRGWEKLRYTCRGKKVAVKIKTSRFPFPPLPSPSLSPFALLRFASPLNYFQLSFTPHGQWIEQGGGRQASACRVIPEVHQHRHHMYAI